MEGGDGWIGVELDQLKLGVRYVTVLVSVGQNAIPLVGNNRLFGAKKYWTPWWRDVDPQARPKGRRYKHRSSPRHLAQCPESGT